MGLIAHSGGDAHGHHVAHSVSNCTYHVRNAASNIAPTNVPNMQKCMGAIRHCRERDVATSGFETPCKGKGLIKKGIQLSRHDNGGGVGSQYCRGREAGGK